MQSRVSSENIVELVSSLRKQVAPQWEEVDQIALANQRRVLKAFHTHRVSDYHFAAGTGYGYNDSGRDVLEAIYAEVFGGEAAFVRPQLASGTHAISACLFGLLRPGDELLYASGAPYDTLQHVIGGDDAPPSSLKAWGIGYRHVELNPDDTLDITGIINSISPQTKVVALQRSRGYSWRRALSVREIGEATQAIKAAHPHVAVFVDNCYGEFVESLEPGHVGVDLLAGSLIKNPGAGIAPAGGYIVGREDLVALAADAAVAPGIGQEVGAMFDLTRTLLQGIFLAPHVTAQAVKGAILMAAAMEKLGFAVSPTWDEARSDIVQAIRFESPEPLIAFCQGIQQAGPVDHFVSPVPAPMPGYADKVVMAAGTFIQGSSIELSADGPIRPPYIAYLQGGLTVEHCQIAVEGAIAAVQAAMKERED
ncbi:MAG: hypothetical protein GX030_10760 [Firmicutes bacterium]|nr:hypothetical protein [Bacillota bacterium]